MNIDTANKKAEEILANERKKQKNKWRILKIFRIIVNLSFVLGYFLYLYLFFQDKNLTNFILRIILNSVGLGCFNIIYLIDFSHKYQQKKQKDRTLKLINKEKE